MDVLCVWQGLFPCVICGGEGGMGNDERVDNGVGVWLLEGA